MTALDETQAADVADHVRDVLEELDAAARLLQRVVTLRTQRDLEQRVMFATYSLRRVVDYLEGDQ